MRRWRLKDIAWGLTAATIFTVVVVTVMRWQEAAELAERGARAALRAYVTGVGSDRGSTIAAERHVRGREHWSPLRFDWELGDVVTCRARVSFSPPIVFPLVFEASFAVTEVNPPRPALALAPVLPAPPPLPPPPPPTVAPPPPPAAPDEVTFRRVVERRPNVALVLDVSGSMRRPIGDTANQFLDCKDPRSSMAALRRATTQLLGRMDKVPFGLVMFADTIIGEAPVGSDHAMIRSRLGAEGTCPCTGASCTTASWLALDRAAQLLQRAPKGTASYVLFISDGQPSTNALTVREGIARTRAAAERLRAMGVSIFTIHLVNTQLDQDALQSFMQSISGPPGHAGDESFYMQAVGPFDLEQLLGSIGDAYALLSGPLPAALARGPLEVVLRETDGQERPVPRAPSGDRHLLTQEVPPYAGEVHYAQQGRRLFVTPLVKERVNRHGDQLVVRRRTPHR